MKNKTKIKLHARKAGKNKDYNLHPRGSATVFHANFTSLFVHPYKIQSPYKSGVELSISESEFAKPPPPPPRRWRFRVGLFSASEIFQLNQGLFLKYLISSLSWSPINFRFHASSNFSDSNLNRSLKGKNLWIVGFYCAFDPFVC